ncbi:MAG: hypothetical protein QOK39_262 [Acidimicrobiaceae bacterium]|jgi:hypothetical protein|nr:hypothetical protein [Acidimicrobiaceae bacterium]
MISVTTSRLANAVAHSTIVLSRLADRIGVEPGQLLDAAALARLPLPSLITVAQVVDYPIQELFARSNNKPPYDDDAAAVGACLGDRPQGLTRDTLARALDWDLDRVETAVRHLDIRLAVAGLRLRAEGATIRIEGSPGLLQLDARQVLDRSPGDGHVDPDLGQAVWVAIFGQDLRDAPEEGLVEAFRRNLVEARGGRARGSEPVKFSLVLTNRGH